MYASVCEVVCVCVFEVFMDDIKCIVRHLIFAEKFYEIVYRRYARYEATLLQQNFCRMHSVYYAS